jgi:hypothetical protein
MLDTNCFFFARVYLCNVLCNERMFHMLDMIVTLYVQVEDHACGFTVTMVIITSLCNSKMMTVLPQVPNRSEPTTPPKSLYYNIVTSILERTVVRVFVHLSSAIASCRLSRAMTPQGEGGSVETTACPIT